MTYKIIYEKYIDPFLPPPENMTLPDVELNDEKSEYKEDDPIGRILTKNDPNRIEDDNYVTSKKPVRAIISSAGVIPIFEHALPSKVFNFWLGHTNFPISDTALEVIDNTLGVETLELITPYRFKIAIGKAFGTGETMNRIFTNVKRDALNVLEQEEELGTNFD